jgi:hypothetical protein
MDRRLITRITAGDIGDNPEEIEFEPIEEPAREPERVPA